MPPCRRLPWRQRVRSHQRILDKQSPLSRRRDEIKHLGESGFAGSISMPIAPTSRVSPTRRDRNLIIVRERAGNPVRPDRLAARAFEDREVAHSQDLPTVRRATIRAAPLARRDSGIDDVKGRCFGYSSAFSSPGKIMRWPTSSPGGASLECMRSESQGVARRQPRAVRSYRASSATISPSSSSPTSTKPKLA